MGHDHLRKDKECQNCGYTVDLGYCSKCGQKNTETRQSFTHLIGHFIEDFTHYDGAFWKTIKYLLFRPAKLTIEYLEGHRMRYVPPVKLYIFISFVTFLLLSLLSHNTTKDVIKTEPKVKLSSDLLKKGVSFGGQNYKYHSVEEYDSIQNSLPEDEKRGFIKYWVEKSTLEKIEEGIEISQIIEGFIHAIPKIIFIYMPIFAFWLWLFHSKKRWLFFDHGIYTLHLFSFLLIISTLNIILNFILGYLNNTIAGIISNIYFIIVSLYSIFYFFRSHSKMYGEKKAISRLKALLLFFINIISIGVVFAISLMLIFYITH
ncbi:hypothetical protein D3C87_340390 [compost metagenome]